MLADAAAGRAAAAARSSRSAASRAGRRSCSPRRHPRARPSSPSTRTPATTAGPARSTGSPPRPRPTGRRSSATSTAPASATACATCRRSPPTPTPRSTAPIDVLYVDGAHRLRARPGPTSVTGARGWRDGGDAARPRRVLVGRRDAGDRPRAAVRAPLPLRRPLAIAGVGTAPTSPRGSGRPGLANAGRQLASSGGSPATSPSRCSSRPAADGVLRRLGRPVPEWPY